MDSNLRSPEKEPKSSPLPKVSAAKYDRPAVVRVRVKGSATEGNTYRGQQLVRQCLNCRKPPLASIIKS
jgi:hypothetical protein